MHMRSARGVPPTQMDDEVKRVTVNFQAQPGLSRRLVGDSQCSALTFQRVCVRSVAGRQPFLRGCPCCWGPQLFAALHASSTATGECSTHQCGASMPLFVRTWHVWAGYAGLCWVQAAAACERPPTAPIPCDSHSMAADELIIGTPLQ